MSLHLLENAETVHSALTDGVSGIDLEYRERTPENVSPVILFHGTISKRLRRHFVVAPDSRSPSNERESLKSNSGIFERLFTLVCYDSELTTVVNFFMQLCGEAV